MYVERIDGHMCVYMESIDDAHACVLYGEDNDMFMCVWISLSLLCLYVNKLPFVLPKC